jgi:hypothetical protein
VERTAILPRQQLFLGAGGLGKGTVGGNKDEGVETRVQPFDSLETGACEFAG